MPAQTRMLSQLTKYNDKYPPRKFVVFFPPASALEHSCGNISPIDVRTVSCFIVWCRRQSPYCKNHDSLQLHSCWTMRDVSRPFSRMPITGHVHSYKRDKKERRNFCTLKLWPQTKFVTTNTICAPPSKILSWWWFEVCSISPVRLL